MFVNQLNPDGHQIEPLPEFVIDRYGLKVETKNSRWVLNSAASGKNIINLSRIKHPVLRYSISRYLIYCIQKLSPTTVSSYSTAIFRQLSAQGLIDVSFNCDIEELRGKIIEALNKTLVDLRAQNKLDQFYQISRWYMWSADHVLGCGFDEEYALVLSRIRIPGDIKGEAVKSQDPKEGPLHFELEEPLVRRALLNDNSDEFEHLQQKLAVSLCIAFGRNPLNYARLREEDFWNMTQDSPEAEQLWQLNIPRVKKRGSPRGLFKTETCHKKLAELITNVLIRNAKYQTKSELKNTSNPIFLRSLPDLNLIGTDSEEYAFHMTAESINKLVESWAKRMEIYSPITNEILHLTPRRLRYTFACNMARQGANRAALAEMLDHTDTQNVGVYYELFDELVGMLDKALSTKVGKLIGLFKGNLIDDFDLAINGKNLNKHLIFVDDKNPVDNFKIGVCGESSLCHLDPPYSCYLCPKFQPYKFADHEHVLDILLKDRKERLIKYQQARLAVQLDDVIYAVGQVAAACKET